MGEKSAASKKSGRLQKIGWRVGCFPNKFLGCVFREVRRWWRPRKASWDAEAMCVLKFGRARAEEGQGKEYSEQRSSERWPGLVVERFVLLD